MKTMMLALFSLLTLAANAWEELPPDDPALRVLDRDLVTIHEGDQEAYFYGVLSNSEDQTYLDVYNWNDFVGYAETAVRQSLVYDRKTGKFTASWSD